MEKIKLSEIKNPHLEIELPDGTTKEYDAWEILENLQREHAAAGESPTIVDGFDATRKAFGFPTAAKAKESGEFTLSQRHCQVLMESAKELVEEASVAKKAPATTPS